MLEILVVLHNVILCNITTLYSIDPQTNVQSSWFLRAVFLVLKTLYTQYQVQTSNWWKPKIPLQKKNLAKKNLEKLTIEGTSMERQKLYQTLLCSVLSRYRPLTIMEEYKNGNWHSSVPIILYNNPWPPRYEETNSTLTERKFIRKVTVPFYLSLFLSIKLKQKTNLSMACLGTKCLLNLKAWVPGLDQSSHSFQLPWYPLLLREWRETSGATRAEWEHSPSQNCSLEPSSWLRDQVRVVCQ